jgi:2,5-diketo-D-gluconate reductase A
MGFGHWQIARTRGVNMRCSLSRVPPWFHVIKTKAAVLTGAVVGVVLLFLYTHHLACEDSYMPAQGESVWPYVLGGVAVGATAVLGVTHLLGAQQPQQQQQQQQPPQQQQQQPPRSGTVDPAVKKSANGLLTYKFNVKGQSGEIPQIGLGTATLGGGVTPDSVCIAAVRTAIRAGYRQFDTALLYNNQESVGEAVRAAIAAGDVTRDELFITSKVGFYPPAATKDNLWVPIEYHVENRHGRATTLAAVDLCLKKLGLNYVDLMLIHNPATELDEYMASNCHTFEILGNVPRQLTLAERDTIMKGRLEKLKYDEAKAEATRAETWKALEEAQKGGKCRYIGVSNYAPRLVKAMEQYATVMPAVNQLELHPTFASPTLQQLARETGCVLTAYGSGNSVAIEKCAVVARIAKRLRTTPLMVVLRWTLQKGVMVIPRTGTASHLVENISCADARYALSATDMAALDAKNTGHPYYWSPLPSQPPGTLPDLKADSKAAPVAAPASAASPPAPVPAATATGDVSNVATGDVSSVAAGDVSNVAAGDVSTVAAGDVSAVAAGDVSTVAAGDVSTTAMSGSRKSAAGIGANGKEIPAKYITYDDDRCKRKHTIAYYSIL